MTSYDPASYPTVDRPAAPGQVAPGWYPVDAQSQRYWDGREWTSHLAPLYANSHGANATNDRTYALIMHLGGLVGGFLIPLIMWLIKKDESPFIDHHGRQSMNFHLSVFIYGIVSLVMIVVVVGFFMLLGLAVCYVVFSILAAVAANNGDYYKFPLTIPFFS